MRLRPFLTSSVAALAVVCSSLPTAFAEPILRGDRQSPVALTLYQNGLTLVEDHRRLVVPTSAEKGRNTVVFDDVAQGMIPASVQVVPPAGAVVTEQAYQPPLDLDQLLRASVGQTITVVQPQATGGEIRQSAKVLRAQPDVLLEQNGAIISGLPGRPEFASLPEGLSPSPRLSATLAGLPGGSADITLRYLSSGLNWSADHVLALSADQKSVALTTWATVTNSSGAPWTQAKLSLVAGQVNQTSAMPAPPMLQKMERGAMMAAASAPMADAPQRESLGGYHLYTVPAAITLADGETRQIALLQAASVPVEVTYEVRGTSARPYLWRGDEETHPTTVLTVQNKGLSAPLPAGTARVYGADSKGATRFLGEDLLSATSDQGKARLTLGEAFDIGVTRTQTSFRKVSDQVYEASYSIVLRNAQSSPVTVIVTDSMPGDWVITHESLKHQSPDAGRAEWSVPLPAAGSTTLTYSLRVTS